jgi:hypothetical protein
LEPYRDCCGYVVVWALGEYFLGSTLGITFVGPCPHRDRDSRIRSHQMDLSGLGIDVKLKERKKRKIQLLEVYLIRTGFFW